MKCKKSKLLFMLAFVVSLFLFVGMIRAPSNPTHTLDTKGVNGCYFLLDNDSRLWFDAEEISLGSSSGLWTWLDDNGVLFYNLRMDGDTETSWRIYIDNANVTVTTLFNENILAYTVSAPSGETSITQVYCGEHGRPTSIEGANSWSYSFASNLATVNVVHSSSQDIEVTWILPVGFTAFVRNNYLVAFTLLALAPIIFACGVIVRGVTRKEAPSIREVLATVSLGVSIVLAFIVVYTVMNAVI